MLGVSMNVVKLLFGTSLRMSLRKLNITPGDEATILSLGSVILWGSYCASHDEGWGST